MNITLVDQVPISATRELSVEDVKEAEARIDKESGIATSGISLLPGPGVRDPFIFGKEIISS